MRYSTVGKRQCGRTTAIVKAAKEIGATVVCATAREADQIRKRHDVMTVGADQFNALVGLDRPIIWDHHAAELAADSLMHANGMIDALRDRVSKLKDELREATRLKAESPPGRDIAMMAALPDTDMVFGGIMALANDGTLWHGRDWRGDEFPLDSPFYARGWTWTRIPGLPKDEVSP